MPPVGADAQLIQSYGTGGFRIANRQYDHSVLVMPTATVAWDGTFEAASLEVLLRAYPKIDVVLMGTGERHELVPPALRGMLKSHGIAFDTMDTGAACRTFNILLGEGRRVAAALRLP